MTNIDTNWPDWGAIANSESYGVGVVVHELAEVDIAIDVSAVIENDASQTSFRDDLAYFDWDWESRFGDDDAQHDAAYRHADNRAS